MSNIYFYCTFLSHYIIISYSFDCTCSPYNLCHNLYEQQCWLSMVICVVPCSEKISCLEVSLTNLLTFPFIGDDCSINL